MLHAVNWWTDKKNIAMHQPARILQPHNQLVEGSVFLNQPSMTCFICKGICYTLSLFLVKPLMLRLCIPFVAVTWNITCSYTQQLAHKAATCCVSFSAWYNDTIVPCTKCACDCPANGTTPVLTSNGADSNNQRCVNRWAPLCPLCLQSVSEYFFMAHSLAVPTIVVGYLK